MTDVNLRLRTPVVRCRKACNGVFRFKIQNRRKSLEFFWLFSGFYGRPCNAENQDIMGYPYALIFFKNFVVTIDITINRCYNIPIRCNKEYYIKARRILL